MHTHNENLQLLIIQLIVRLKTDHVHIHLLQLRGKGNLNLSITTWQHKKQMVRSQETYFLCCISLYNVTNRLNRRETLIKQFLKLLCFFKHNGDLCQSNQIK